MNLDDLNQADPEALTVSLLACCDVPRWAASLVEARPYADDDSLLETADRLARTFSHAEVERALAAHPRIGERAAGRGTEAAWSRQEQAGVGRDGQVAADLVAANRAYEERFGRVFLICATGLGAGEILASARHRLDNDDDTEADVVKDELRKIALLRLRKVLEE